MMEEDYAEMHRPPYEPIPAGLRALGMLVMMLDEDEWIAFAHHAGTAIRLAAVALRKYEAASARQ